MLSSSAVVRHRKVIGFFETLTSVIRRMRSSDERPSVSLKLEWIFDREDFALITARGLDIVFLHRRDRLLFDATTASV